MNYRTIFIVLFTIVSTFNCYGQHEWMKYSEPLDIVFKLRNESNGKVLYGKLDSGRVFSYSDGHSQDKLETITFNNWDDNYGLKVIRIENDFSENQTRNNEELFYFSRVISPSYTKNKSKDKSKIKSYISFNPKDYGIGCCGVYIFRIVFTNGDDEVVIEEFRLEIN